ncbi:hypothetical protein [Nostoc sp. ChiQUE01b]|uniref:hypothetical protein n=1 Tax=Nostoc sp. ChiQUE01b TaxID=3075376 RepID=UPI002AD591C3|nr:hypothetical protein [Nostoc sp. ChiQUE01b]MDZ8257711.1 hypothetical protein [Nostoc sp. ChiQUE01b]
MLPNTSFTANVQASLIRQATSVFEVDDPKLKRVRVSLWKNLHFRKAATRSMSLIKVERFDLQDNEQVSKPL